VKHCFSRLCLVALKPRLPSKLSQKSSLARHQLEETILLLTSSLTKSGALLARRMWLGVGSSKTSTILSHDNYTRHTIKAPGLVPGSGTGTGTGTDRHAESTRPYEEAKLANGPESRKVSHTHVCSGRDLHPFINPSISRSRY
jgi:hypothetical protein